MLSAALGLNFYINLSLKRALLFLFRLLTTEKTMNKRRVQKQLNQIKAFLCHIHLFDLNNFRTFCMKEKNVVYVPSLKPKP